MNIYIFALMGLILGSVIGWFAPISIPAHYAPYTSVAVLAALDAIFGGSRAALERVFDIQNFIIGFVANMVLAVFLVSIGNLIGINLYYVALIGFGIRVFLNVSAIRNIVMTKRL